MSRKTKFYTLPARCLKEGMSTDDGQDILSVSTEGGFTLYHVYTPSDDPDEDEENQCAPEGRIRPTEDRVGLAVFHNTPVDGSKHKEAVVEKKKKKKKC
jgi:hypothetical protein